MKQLMCLALALSLVPPAGAISKRKKIALIIAMHAVATLDAGLTRQASYQGCHEANPVYRPFFHSPAIYGVAQLNALMADVLLFKRRDDRITKAAVVSVFTSHGLGIGITARSLGESSGFHAAGPKQAASSGSASHSLSSPWR